MLQQGKFFAGTFGYPVRIQVGVPLSDLVSITLTLGRPSTSSLVKALDVATCVSDAVLGEITYVIEDGDLPLTGKYVLGLVIVKSGNRHLTAKAIMEVG